MKAGRRSGALSLERAGNEFLLLQLGNSHGRNLIYLRSRECPLMAHSGHRLVRCMSAFDPKRTLAVHCGNGFDADFNLYQSTRLSRYSAGSRA